MKFRTSLLSILLLAEATLSLAIPIEFAWARGNEGGHGGDGYAAEFVALAHAVAIHLEGSGYRELSQSVGLDLVRLKKAIASTRVYSQDAEHVRIDGNAVDAINYRGGPIIINRTNWRSAMLLHKLKIALHEYLGILEMELDTYEVSNLFSDALRALATRLIVQQSKLIKYYGTAVASPPMTVSHSKCQIDQDWLLEAKKLASSIAGERCRIERGSNCGKVSFVAQEVHSRAMPGFAYCEITAITAD